MYRTASFSSVWTAGVVVLTAGVAQATTVSHDFSDGTAGPFTLTNSVAESNWTIDEENNTLGFMRGTTSEFSLGASANIAGSSNESFSLSTSINPTMNFGGGHLALHARALSPNLGGNHNSTPAGELGYQARLSQQPFGRTYQVRLFDGNTQIAGSGELSFDDFPVSGLGFLAWTFDGVVQENGDLFMSTTLTNGGDYEVTVDHTVLAADVVGNGTNYGFRAFAFNVGNAVNNPTGAQLDTLSVTAVPEPSTLGLGLLGACTMMLRRRR